MKKLITLLSGLTITASSASVAVACTNYDHKVDGNSILVQFLQSMDGVAQIDASDVLWELINQSGPANRESFLIQLLNLINVSILSNSEQNFGETGSILDDASSFINTGLGDALINKWKSVSAAVDLQIQREKDSYQRANGKNWLSKWKQMLVDKYSVYQKDTGDMDLDFLEAKYKANILMTDASNSATKGILDVLLNTDSFGVTWVTSTTVASKFNALKSVVGDDAKFQQVFDADKLAIQQIENAQEADATKWAKKIDYTVEEAKAVISGLADASTLEHDVPEDTNVWSANGSASRAGMLSNSQLFFLNKYYETKAPLAISEVVIAFSDNQKFDDGITPEDFNGDNEVDSKATNRLLPNLLDDNLWNAALVKNDVFTTYQSKASVKTYDSLLTLTNSNYSNTLKSVVYDYVLKGNGASDEPIQPDVASDNQLSKIVTDLNRSSDKKLYAQFGSDGNKLVYIDTDGIHVVRIEGWDYFKDAESNAERANTLTELQSFNKFHNLKDSEKIEGLFSGTGRPQMELLNTAISNKYLQYLVNTSLLKGLTSSPVNYDIMSEVKSWATISNSSDSETYWITTVLEYFENISNISPEGSDSSNNDIIKTFVGKFLVFGSSNAANQTANDIAESMENWAIDKISTAQQTIQIASSVKFVEMFKNWRKSIESNTAAEYPKGLIDGDKFGDSTLAESVKEIWLVTTDPPSTSGESSSNLKVLDVYYLFNTMTEKGTDL
ncbi:hypothetical protein SCLARK_00599 [Spiroplasma clarkii]|uniref:Lipoprotein n=1 Tax=Spiroplasma clarkii TaxID=2139 RepID=A0A1Y0L0H3_9MOLU|nr:lipoprotein [Spiroplasma clarkii]ARU91270.1 hypothetical protein SCLARK_00599 [Spiroplasma clarkii]ATX70707.1 hypothetical protein SCLAR_v1c03770 [Spiroplasma clarkii]